jgi:hypothetical protein
MPEEMCTTGATSGEVEGRYVGGSGKPQLNVKPPCPNQCAIGQYTRSAAIGVEERHANSHTVRHMQPAMRAGVDGEHHGTWLGAGFDGRRSRRLPGVTRAPEPVHNIIIPQSPFKRGIG